MRRFVSEQERLKAQAAGQPAWGVIGDAANHQRYMKLYLWKVDGETCVCHKPKDHDGDHECSCGTWFAGQGLCGHPPEYRKSEDA
jgi:hypothetical protein